MARSWRLVLPILAVLSLGCTRPQPLTDASSAPGPLDGSSLSPGQGTSPDASSLSSGASLDASPSPGADAMAGFLVARPLAGRSIGHTSVVFKLKLEGGRTAAFKPNSRRGKNRYRGEVAARRLALHLGLRNVPEARLRSFPVPGLREVLDAEGRALLDREALSPGPGQGGGVPGALIPWIDGLEIFPLEQEPLFSRWRGAVGEGDLSALSEAERALFGQASTLVAFDTLSGNWDRWSGGNVGVDRLETLLLFIDNDGAFFPAPPPDGLARQRRLLRDVRRFSRSFVGRLRSLGERDLREALGSDLEGAPLLSDKAIEGVVARAGEVLAHVDSVIAKYGVEKVLVFP